MSLGETPKSQSKVGTQSSKHAYILKSYVLLFTNVPKSKIKISFLKIFIIQYKKISSKEGKTQHQYPLFGHKGDEISQKIVGKKKKKTLGLTQNQISTNLKLILSLTLSFLYPSTYIKKWVSVCNFLMR